MSFRGKRELLMHVAPRYRSARHGQRSIILDEFVAVTGYERKYAIRLLLGPIRPPSAIRRPRAPHYGLDVQAALSVLWSAANGICAKRLVPFLPELVPTLERHGHLVVTDNVRTQLLALSPATVDRLLRPLRQPHGLSTTKPGRLLKKQIPVRTFAEWTDVKPGFLEGDLVAHCGGTTDGAFLYTLTLTDVATTWTECLALLHRSQHGVVQALNQARRLFPFPILGIDTDNGSEFINEELLAYCTSEQITFTRGRVGNKNDQCFVEQRNGSVVRQLVGYDRFEGQRAYRQLAELYRAVRLYVNFFQPSMKLRTKTRTGSRVRRMYGPAQTPFQRVLASGVLDVSNQRRLMAVYRALDPVRLLRQLETLQEALWRHSPQSSNAMRYGSRYPSASPTVASRACPACGGLPPSARSVYCTPACKQLAYRRRRRTLHSTVDPAIVRKELQRRRLLDAHTVYECSRCGERVLGERRCGDCNLYARSIGLGGSCPGCDTVILLADLLELEGMAPS